MFLNENKVLNEIVEILDYINDELIINEYIKNCNEPKSKQAFVYIKSILQDARRTYKWH